MRSSDDDDDDDDDEEEDEGDEAYEARDGDDDDDEEEDEDDDEGDEAYEARDGDDDDDDDVVVTQRDVKAANIASLVNGTLETCARPYVRGLTVEDPAVTLKRAFKSPFPNAPNRSGAGRAMRCDGDANGMEARETRLNLRVGEGNRAPEGRRRRAKTDDETRASNDRDSCEQRNWSDGWRVDGCSCRGGRRRATSRGRCRSRRSARRRRRRSYCRKGSRI